MAERQGATVKEVTAETGSNFTLAELEAAVKVKFFFKLDAGYTVIS